MVELLQRSMTKYICNCINETRAKCHNLFGSALMENTRLIFQTSQNGRRDVNLESFMKDTDKILHAYLNDHFRKQRYVLLCFYFVFATIVGYF